MITRLHATQLKQICCQVIRFLVSTSGGDTPASSASGTPGGISRYGNPLCQKIKLGKALMAADRSVLVKVDSMYLSSIMIGAVLISFGKKYMMINLKPLVMLTKHITIHNWQRRLISSFLIFGINEANIAK